MWSRFSMLICWFDLWTINYNGFRTCCETVNLHTCFERLKTMGPSHHWPLQPHEYSPVGEAKPQNGLTKETWIRAKLVLVIFFGNSFEQNQFELEWLECRTTKSTRGKQPLYMPVWDIICSQLTHQNGLLVIWGQRILLKGFSVWSI